MELIFSKFAKDEDWQELLEEFVAEIPQRIEALSEAVASEDVERLKVLVHQLKGACGSYGFEAITPVAMELEGRLIKYANIDNCRQQLEHFQNCLRSMSCLGTPLG